jgi:hypothetical protein
MQHVAVVYIIPMVRFHPPARHSSRLGQRFQLALGAAAALAATVLTPGSAQAYVVTVGGVQYDVTTFTGSYDANTSKFALPPAPGVMPWWGSSSNATAFASAVGTNLGTPNNPYGPFFAHSYDPNYDSMGDGSFLLLSFLLPLFKVIQPMAMGFYNPPNLTLFMRKQRSTPPLPPPLPLLPAPCLCSEPLPPSASAAS